MLVRSDVTHPLSGELLDIALQLVVAAGQELDVGVRLGEDLCTAVRCSLGLLKLRCQLGGRALGCLQVTLHATVCVRYRCTAHWMAAACRGSYQ